MLRHIMSVGLAVTACATFMSTKANAASLTVTPVGSLQKKPGDSITFLLSLNPAASNPLPLGTTNRNLINFQTITYDFDDEDNELSFQPKDGSIILPTSLTSTTTVATLIFNVIRPIKDGKSDFFDAKAFYTDVKGKFTETAISSEVFDVVPVIEPVPEPLTMLGAAAALGYGAILKRKYSKNTES